MLKNLILIENDEKYQFDTLEELVKTIIDKDYYDMTNKQKQEKLELKAFANSFGKEEILKQINVKNEVTYILSLLVINKFMILESVNSDIFTKAMNKSNLNGNYIIVNKFAKELLEKIDNTRC